MPTIVNLFLVKKSKKRPLHYWYKRSGRQETVQRETISYFLMSFFVSKRRNIVNDGLDSGQDMGLEPRVIECM